MNPTVIPGFLGSLFAKYEPLVYSFGKVFVFTFIGTILAYWLGLTNANVSGLVGAVKNDWDAAGGISIIAGLTAVGFKVPAAVKTKSI